MGLQFFFVGSTIILFLCDSFCCSPLLFLSLSLLSFYSRPAFIGPASSPSLLRIVVSTVLLFMDVHYRVQKLFFIFDLTLLFYAFINLSSFQLYCLIFYVLVPYWSSSLSCHLYFLVCGCRCPCSRPFNRWLDLASFSL